MDVAVTSLSCGRADLGRARGEDGSLPRACESSRGRREPLVIIGGGVDVRRGGRGSRGFEWSFPHCGRHAVGPWPCGPCPATFVEKGASSVVFEDKNQKPKLYERGMVL